jgi:hypothetical protein
MARNTASNAPPLRMGQGRTTRERLASALARETRRLGHWSCGARPSMPCSSPSCLHVDPCCDLYPQGAPLVHGLLRRSQGAGRKESACLHFRTPGR